MESSHFVPRNWKLASVLLLMSVFFLSSCSESSLKLDHRTPVISTPEVTVNQPGLPYCDIDYNFPLSAASNPTLYVYKSERRLIVVEHDTLIRDYHIALGFHPNGDKFMRGDGRTPEGDFYVCVKKPESQFYKSLGLSYPDPKHAEEAVDIGAISKEEFAKIKQAYESKATPPWNTPLGGAIFIHGGGAAEDWTLGCIALANSAMDELFDAVRIGTPVKILP